MFGADTHICRNTRVRLWGHLEAYGVGAGTSPGRCKGVSWRGEGVAAKFGGRVCDVIVTLHDLRRLEMVLPRLGPCLLLCLG
jgi:hypothetical protein